MAHVLIVEDHEENRNLLKMLLEANGYRVTAAGDGLEALAIARRDPPDAIVSDVLMPKLDGFALCRAWTQDPGLRAIPFIFYSATNVRPEDEEFAMALGAVRYLIRPLEAEVFLAELRAVLQRWTGPAAPASAPPLDDAIFHPLHELALSHKIEDKIAQLEAANRRLQESEARFRSLTEVSSDFYWESDTEHRITQRTAGRDSAALSVFWRDAQIGKRRWETPYLSPDEAGWQAHRAVLDAHRPFRNFELSRAYADGTEHFRSISGNPVFDASGAFKGYRGVGIDITERKRGEQVQVRFGSAMDTIADAIYLVDRSSMRFIHVNDAACRMQRKTRAELLALGPDGVLSISRAELERIYDTMIASGVDAEPLEMLRTRKDGSQVWFELRRHAQRSGDRWTIVTVVRDITERKKTEAGLKLFRALIDQSSDAIEVVDPDTFRYIDVNETGCQALGYSREEMLSMTVFDIDPLYDRSTSKERIQNLRESGSNILESRHRRKDGSEFPVEVSLAYIELDRNYVLAIARDITERQQADRQLVESEQRFRSLVEQSIAGAYIVQDGKFAYVNPRAAEIIGLGSADELVGSDPLQSIAEADRDRVAQNMRRVLDGETQNVAMDFAALRRDGATVQIGGNASRAMHQGRPAIIGLIQDISEKRRAEDEIKRYVAQLETAFMSTVEVATTLGELRDPYTAGHQRRVAEIAVAIGAELGFDGRRQEGLRVAGYLHDLGKITIPAEILSKPGKLSPIEFTLIQGHAQAGFEVLKNVKFSWPVADVALQHHERIDGSGYPQGLRGNAILIEARILAVADVIEAMSSHRPYRAGFGIDKTLAEIERGRGTSYDPAVADACLRLFREKGYQIPA